MPKQKAQSEVVKVQDLPHFTVEAACIYCKAEMHGEWIGEPKRQTLKCPACEQLYIVDFGEKHESKPTSSTKPARPATADEMRLALSRLASVRQHLTLLRDDDDPVTVLEDVIDEALASRGHIERRRNFDQLWLQETAKR